MAFAKKPDNFDRELPESLDEPMSQEGVAEYFGTHREVIAKIETLALRKLEKALHAKGYKPSDFLGDDHRRHESPFYSFTGEPM